MNRLSTNLGLYEARLRELHTLIRGDKGDAYEAELVRAEMDELWSSMTIEEVERANRLSARLGQCALVVRDHWRQRHDLLYVLSIARLFPFDQITLRRYLTLLMSPPRTQKLEIVDLTTQADLPPTLRGKPVDQLMRTKTLRWSLLINRYLEGVIGLDQLQGQDLDLYSVITLAVLPYACLSFKGYLLENKDVEDALDIRLQVTRDYFELLRQSVKRVMFKYAYNQAHWIELNEDWLARWQAPYREE